MLYGQGNQYMNHKQRRFKAYDLNNMLGSFVKLTATGFVAVS